MVNPHARRLGFCAALAASVAAIGFSVVQCLQVLGTLASPVDEVLIYGFSLCIATPYVLAMLALHYSLPEEKRIWSHAALLFGVIYVVYVTLNYVVQLGTVVPARVRGTVAEIRILDQTPHSLFWDVDAIGYIFMGVSTLFAALVFARNGPERWLRRALIANACITPLIGVVYFYPRFSIALLFAGIPWLVTVPASLVLLTRYFRRLSV
jgi:hypothetical protein